MPGAAPGRQGLLPIALAAAMLLILIGASPVAIETGSTSAVIGTIVSFVLVFLFVFVVDFLPLVFFEIVVVFLLVVRDVPSLLLETELRFCPVPLALRGKFPEDPLL